MTTELMLLWMMVKHVEVKEIPLQEAPQVTCPLSMDEYLGLFQWWAREDVRKRQLERDNSLRWKI